VGHYELRHLHPCLQDLKAARVGDTWHLAGARPNIEPLPGFRAAKSMVYASLYPVDADDFDALAVVGFVCCLERVLTSVCKCVNIRVREAECLRVRACVCTRVNAQVENARVCACALSGHSYPL